MMRIKELVRDEYKKPPISFPFIFLGKKRGGRRWCGWCKSRWSCGKKS